MIHHKADKLNKRVYALSKRYFLLSVLESKVLGLEIVKGMYADDEDFKEIHAKCASHPHGLFKRGLSSRDPCFAYLNMGLGSC